jgi:hypothetical protein
MVNPIKTGLNVSDREAERRPAKREDEGEGAASPAPPSGEAEFPPISPGADLRLVIERDAEGVDYIYRLIDRATGRVVAERSRDQVTSLADGPGYRAGSVVSTKA